MLMFSIHISHSDIIPCILMNCCYTATLLIWWFPLERDYHFYKAKYWMYQVVFLQNQLMYFHTHDQPPQILSITTVKVQKMAEFQLPIYRTSFIYEVHCIFTRCVVFLTKYYNIWFRITKNAFRSYGIWYTNSL